MTNDINVQIISPNLLELKTFNPKLRLAILASGKGSNFEAIINDINNKRLDAEIICLIVNEPNCGAIDIARRFSIPFIILNHRDYADREKLDEAIIESLNTYNIELLIMVGWMRIITHKLLNRYKDRVINLHPSLLPSFKGKNAIKDAFDRRVKITGCSVHIVQEEIDSGPILVQGAIPLTNNQSYQSLTKSMHILEHRVISIGISIAGDLLRN